MTSSITEAESDAEILNGLCRVCGNGDSPCFEANMYETHELLTGIWLLIQSLDRYMFSVSC